MNKQTCPVCKKEKLSNQFVRGIVVRPEIAQLIKADHPDWSEKDPICKTDLSHYRALAFRHILENEKGELSALDQQVLENIRNQEFVVNDHLKQYDAQASFGERLADKIAEFGGSWKFIILFALLLMTWIMINIYFLRHPYDPYPFILLNLVLSCLAAIQAPVIMMSQNRQEDKDRLRAEQDYRINLKAELEVKALNEKIEHIFLQQWERILEIQQMQAEFMDEISHRKK